MKRGTRILIVDDDINVYDPADVEWALATRVMVNRDVTITPGRSSTGGPLDSGKLGIDATAPLKDRRWYQRVKIPGVEKAPTI